MRVCHDSIVVALTTLIASSAVAQLDAPPIIDAKPLNADASIAAVTLYPGRAAVTRRAQVDVPAGVYELKFSGLPETIQPDSLQARTTGGGSGAGLKVLNVDFVQQAVADVTVSPEIAQLDKDIAGHATAMREVADQRDLIKSQEDFLAALTIRTTADAAGAGGTERLDLDAVKRQMEFITHERERLQTERRQLDERQAKLEKEQAALKTNRDAAAGRAGVARSALVTVVAPESFKGEVALTYLVANAAWAPAYNVRATTDLSSVQIEYDALLTQKTGEDWNDVRLTLSTAQPNVAANPPTIAPWYVDVARPEAAGGRFEEARAAHDVERLKSAAATPAEAYRRDLDKADLEGLAASALVAGGGPSVTFELPRSVSVKTSSERQQRTRISTIETRSLFVHVATPLLTEEVYLRGDLNNSSAYQLLPGRAAIFLGQDYVGPTTMPSVAPGGMLQMHFGIDHAVKARKQLVSKTTENTGLLSGGRRTSYQYRIAIDNGSGRDITLELWDRLPVSRTEEIQIQLVDLSTKLTNDQQYVTEQQPQGLLKWWLTVPSTSRGQNPAVITYGVRVDRGKNVEMTPMPE